MTQPLMGAVNTAVMGQLPDPKYIAAVALGAILFNNIYWFLVFCVSVPLDYAAQALGSGSREEGLLAFLNDRCYIAVIVSCSCIILQKPILTAYLSIGCSGFGYVAELCSATMNLIWERRWYCSIMCR